MHGGTVHSGSAESAVTRTVRRCLTLAVLWSGAANAVFIPVTEFVAVDEIFLVNTSSVDGRSSTHTATLTAPGSTTPTATRSVQSFFEASISFPLAYGETGEHSFAIDGTTTRVAAEDCSTSFFGHVNCVDITLSLDPPGSYHLEDSIVVVPEALSDVDLLFVGEVGDLLSAKPVNPDLYGVSARVTSATFSFFANGEAIGRDEGLVFDAPGFYLVDWAGTTLDSMVIRGFETCGNILFPSVCETFTFFPDADLPLSGPHTYGVWVQPAAATAPAGVSEPSTVLTLGLALAALSLFRGCGVHGSRARLIARSKPVGFGRDTPTWHTGMRAGTPWWPEIDTRGQPLRLAVISRFPTPTRSSRKPCLVADPGAARVTGSHSRCPHVGDTHSESSNQFNTGDSNMARKARHSVTTILAASVLTASGAAHGALFTGLGDLPGGFVTSRGFDISSDGAVVVGVSDGSIGLEAFRWTADGGMVGIGFLPGGSFASAARGTSADGSVVVGDGTRANGGEAFRWTEGSGMVGLGDLAGGTVLSQAFATSADGAVVVGSSRGTNGTEAFRWTAGGGMVGLGDLAGSRFFSQALATSADGSVVVGEGLGANGVEAFRWTEGGGMVGLGDLPGGDFASRANGISADGSVVVGRATGAIDFEAFRWTADDGMVGLGDLPGGIFSSQANATSADGSVVVGEGFGANGREAFIWSSADGLRALSDVVTGEFGLDLTGWVLESALGVSADGLSITGFGTDPDGNTEGWFASLARDGNASSAPEPASEALLALGLFAAGCSRRRRRR